MGFERLSPCNFFTTLVDESNNGVSVSEELALFNKFSVIHLFIY